MITVKRVIASVSGKGGTGKTMLAANLAYALEHRGQEVGILDCDVRSPNMTCVLGIPDDVMLESGPDGRKIVKRLWGDIFVMSSALSAKNFSSTTITGREVSDYLKGVIMNFTWPAPLDYLILDMDPSTGDAMKAVHEMFKGKLTFVIISSSDVSSLSDCRRMVSACSRRKPPIPIIGIVANLVGSECPTCNSVIVCDHCGISISFGEEANVVMLAKDMGIPYLGAIRFNPAIKERTDHGDPILPNNAVIKSILENQ